MLGRSLPNRPELAKEVEELFCSDVVAIGIRISVISFCDDDNFMA
jgi:hypothetical protein